MVRNSKKLRLRSSNSDVLLSLYVKVTLALTLVDSRSAATRKEAEKYEPDGTLRTLPSQMRLSANPGPV